MRTITRAGRGPDGAPTGGPVRWRRVALATAAVVVLSVTVAVVHYRPLLRTGTGYAAHNACAVRLVAGRGADAPDADLPENPLVPLLRTRVDVRDGTARSAVLGVLNAQTAYYTPGYGCTLAGQRPDLEVEPPAGRVVEVRPGPGGGDPPLTARDPAVAAAVDAAFGADPAERERLGTRAVVVVHRGALLAERYADGFSPQTPQLGWSMAKSVTNLMAGRLVRQGRLSLADDRLLPEWTDRRSAITVDQLLRMTSGLAWDETYALGSPVTRMLYLEPDMAGYAASLPPTSAPGSRQQYSSGSTNILCRVLEERSGLGPDLARSLVFEPLGMSGAVLEPDVAGHPVCSSYLWATPRDWALVGQFALQEGRWNGEDLLPPGWMAASTTPTRVPGDAPGLAASWWTNRLADGSLRFPAMPADTYWASGHDGQQVLVVPSADLVVVRMGFTPAHVDPGTDRLVGGLVAALAAESS